MLKKMNDNKLTQCQMLVLQLCIFMIVKSNFGLVLMVCETNIFFLFNTNGLKIKTQNYGMAYYEMF